MLNAPDQRVSVQRVFHLFALAAGLVVHGNAVLCHRKLRVAVYVGQAAVFSPPDIFLWVELLVYVSLHVFEKALGQILPQRGHGPRQRCLEPLFQRRKILVQPCDSGRCAPAHIPAPFRHFRDLTKMVPGIRQGISPSCPPVRRGSKSGADRRVSPAVSPARLILSNA